MRKIFVPEGRKPSGSNTIWNSVDGVRREVMRRTNGKFICYCRCYMRDGTLYLCGCPHDHTETLKEYFSEKPHDSQSVGAVGDVGPSDIHPETDAAAVTSSQDDDDVEPSDSAPEIDAAAVTPSRKQPHRSVKTQRFSIDDYRLSDQTRKTLTAVFFVDPGTAAELEVIPPIKGEHTDLCPNDLAVHLNELLNSPEAVRQLETLFNCSITGNAGVKVKKSSNSDEGCSDGVFATRTFKPGKPVVYYGGLGISFREDDEEEKEEVYSDRKIHMRVEIIYPNGVTHTIECLLIGYEHHKLAEKFTLSCGAFVNHACIPNCVIEMFPLEFKRDGYTFRIMLPYFRVREDLGEDVLPGAELTADYGPSVCYSSPFYEEEYQQAIMKAQFIPESTQQNEVLMDVPRKHDKAALRKFLGRSKGMDCNCCDCRFCSNSGEHSVFAKPFHRSVLNMGPNDVCTEKFLKFIGFHGSLTPKITKSRSKSTPSKQSVCPQASARRAQVDDEIDADIGGGSYADFGLGLTDDFQPVFRAVSSSGIGAASSAASGIGAASSAGTGAASSAGTGAASSAGIGAALSTEIRGAFDVSSLSDSGFFNSEMGSGSARSGGSSSTGALVSRVSRRCIGASRSYDGNSSRTGYTYARRFVDGKYLPFAAVVFMDKDEPYEKGMARWRYLQFIHGKSKKQPEMAGPLSPTFAEIAARPRASDGESSCTDVSAPPAVVPVAGGGGTSSYAENAAVLLARQSKHPDQIAQANEVMHPPPPIPPDRN